MLRERWSTWPVWGRILAIYLGSRVITTIMALIFMWFQEDSWQSRARPTYLEFASMWDSGRWYGSIAEQGYPSVLPREANGEVSQNQWAFMPVFPFLVRALMEVTRLGFAECGIAVALVSGYFACLLLHRILRHTVDEDRAMFTVLLFCVCPVNLLFQVAYADALHLLMVFGLIELLIQRRWLAMIPLIVVASFTRPTGLAWAFALGLTFLLHWWRQRRDGIEFPVAERWRAVAATVVSLLSGYAWVWVAAAVTGVPDAYLRTEYAWRPGLEQAFGGHSPFAGFVQGATFLVMVLTGAPFTEITYFSWPVVGGIAVVLGLYLGVTRFLASQRMRRLLSPEILLWSFAYLSYIVAVFFPQSSTTRIFWPLAPLLVALTGTRSRVWRALIVVAMLALGVWWCSEAWWIQNPNDTSPP